LREVFIPFGSGGKAHCKWCVLLWTPCTSNTNKLEEVQWRAMKVIKGLKQGGTYKKRLRELGFFSLRNAKRRPYCCLLLPNERI